jgi:phosphoglycolate phosphatase-like HAD superfamily hydrolase
MTRTLVLWDIDHTLIENGGVNREAFALAFQLLTGRPAKEPVETDGRTELAVIRLLFNRHGLPPPEDGARAQQALVDALAAKAEQLRERGTVLPGAEASLRLIGGRRDVIQSVLTGNLRANAVLKLAAFGLDRHMDLDVGAYGSDDPVRTRLVAVAQARAEARYGVRFDRENTVLIGDTQRDVRAGLEGGARVVAVATGTASLEELRSAGADVTLANLTAPDAVLDAIIGGSAAARGPG